MVKKLLAHKANVNQQSTDGSTALMLAAERFGAGVISLLLKAGADITLKDAHGRTALERAGNDKARNVLQAAQQQQQPPQADLGMVYQQLNQLNTTLKKLYAAL